MVQKQRRWSLDRIKQEFSISRTTSLEVLDTILVTRYQPPTEIASFLEKHRLLLERKANIWNEEDLKMKFIAQVLSVVNFDENGLDYSSFFEQKLQAEINGKIVSVKTDMVVASGISEAHEPYFFMQEFKKERGADNDPLAQVLAAMAIAKSSNEQVPEVLYGSYIVGRAWFFVALLGKEFAVSPLFDASKEADLNGIIGILLNVKSFIERYLSKKESSEKV